MWTAKTPFAPPGTKLDLEAGTALTPKFDEHGLVPVIAQDVETGAVLMLAWMNAEALARTIATGEAWYWSRSRAAYWRKGETSGNTQTVVSLATDCDQDAILMQVRQIGPACHTNRRSCFYRRIEKAPDGRVSLVFSDDSSH